MNTDTRKILTKWARVLDHYGKLDNWTKEDNISILSAYIRSKEDNKKIRNLVRQIRDAAVCPTFKREIVLNKLKEVLLLIENKEKKSKRLAKKNKNKVSGEGIENHFRAQTQRLFVERLKFKDGMLLRKFDVETERPQDAHKVRRIIEKRMGQAYHNAHKGLAAEMPSNETRYWEKRGTSYELYNIGQIEEIHSISRGNSTHWKRMFDQFTGKVVYKKKMVYSTLESAYEAINQWKIKHPEDMVKMEAYQCAACGKWHIGHSILPTYRKSLNIVA